MAHVDVQVVLVLCVVVGTQYHAENVAGVVARRVQKIAKWSRCVPVFFDRNDTPVSQLEASHIPGVRVSMLAHGSG